MRDRIVLFITGLIGAFVILSGLGSFILVYTGRIDGEDSDVWRPLFDLVAILVGAVAGYIGGVEMERNRHRDGDKGDKDDGE